MHQFLIYNTKSMALIQIIVAKAKKIEAFYIFFRYKFFIADSSSLNAYLFC